MFRRFLVASMAMAVFVRAFVAGQASVSLDAAACNAFECASMQKMVRVNLVGT